jgi:hypothetical protein
MTTLRRPAQRTPKLQAHLDRVRKGYVLYAPKLKPASVPSESWWLTDLTREEFQAKAAARAEQTKDSTHFQPKVQQEW